MLNNQLKKKRILFRVDAGGEVGLGHFYRSLHVAKALKKNGHYIKFIYRPSLFWKKQLKSFPFNQEPLETNNEESHTLQLIRNEKFDIFYVDGLIDFSEQAFNKIKENTCIIFYQNNTDSKTLADVFILPSIHQDQTFFENFKNNTKIYKGTKYFTFNEKIQNLSNKIKPHRLKFKKIGIVTGGSDPKNVLLTICHMIDYQRFSDINFTFFYGEDYDISRLKPKLVQENMLVELFSPEKAIECDLLICTFGVSTYEFMSLGMPIISIAHQQSNNLASEKLAELTKAIHHLGHIEAIQASGLNQAIDFLMHNEQERESLIKKSLQTIDLNGVNRVVKIIESCS